MDKLPNDLPPKMNKVRLRNSPPTHPMLYCLIAGTEFLRFRDIQVLVPQSHLSGSTSYFLIFIPHFNFAIQLLHFHKLLSFVVFFSFLLLRKKLEMEILMGRRSCDSSFQLLGTVRHPLVRQPHYPVYGQIHTMS